MVGIDDPFDGPVVGPQRSRRRGQPGHAASSFIATSGILPRDQFPQFESWPSARWDKPGGPFEPHTGDQYVYSQIADVSYKRLTREIAVPAGGGSLTFWTSYDTEAAWDHLFVEARTRGRRRLDDAARTPTGTPRTATGRQLPGGLASTCTRSSTTTRRSTATAPARRPARPAPGTPPRGNSAGWQEWSDRPRRVRRRTVEISITYASDWATQGLGVFVDDIVLPDGTTTSFETGLDGWAITGPPRGQRAQRQQLGPHRRLRLPGRRRDHHAELDPDGLRARGDRRHRRPATR